MSKHRADSAPLDEDVSGHTGSFFVQHKDGRECWWHHRLGKWATRNVLNVWVLECLREHPEPYSDFFKNQTQIPALLEN